MKGGTYQRIGRNLAKILNNGVKFVTKDTNGGRDNLVDLLNGEVQFGFVQKPILADFARSNSKEAGKITVIARICPAYLQLVVSKKSEQKLVTVTDQAKQPSPEYVDVVRSLDGLAKILKEKEFAGRPEQFHIYLGPIGSNSYFLASSILASHGLRAGYHYARVDTLSTFDEAMKKFGKGGVDGVDAAFIADGLPTPAIGRAMSEKDAKLLAVTRLGEPNALEREDTIPRWTYQSQKEDCPTLRVCSKSPMLWSVSVVACTETDPGTSPRSADGASTESY